MATSAFKNFLRYPHGREKTVEGIDYEKAEFVTCPKCWMKYIYIYLTFIFAMIAIWFAIETRNLGACITTMVFVLVFNSISEIVLPRLLPGTNECQDIPFPPQSGEFIELIPFMHLIFKYTSEESKERFLQRVSEEETECEIETENNLVRRNLSRDEQGSDSMIPQSGSRNNIASLDVSEETLSRHEFYIDHETKTGLFHRSLPEEKNEVEADLLNPPLLENGKLKQKMSEEESEAGLLRRPSFDRRLFRRPISEGEIGLLRRPPFEENLIRRPISEGESKAGHLHRQLFERKPSYVLETNKEE